MGWEALVENFGLLSPLLCLAEEGHADGSAVEVPELLLGLLRGWAVRWKCSEELLHDAQDGLEGWFFRHHWPQGRLKACVGYPVKHPGQVLVLVRSSAGKYLCSQDPKGICGATLNHCCTITLEGDGLTSRLTHITREGRPFSMQLLWWPVQLGLLAGGRVVPNPEGGKPKASNLHL